MKDIKSQAEQAEAHIKAAVKMAFKDLNDVVKHKTDILRAGRLELTRQYKEVQFMQDFLRV